MCVMESKNPILPEYSQNIFVRLLMQNVVHCLTFSFLLLCVNILYRKGRNVYGNVRFNKLFPRVCWTFANLSILDGCITLIKIKKDGIKILDQLVAQYGPNYRLPIAAQEVVAISDPEIIKKLLSSANPAHLNKPQYFYQVAFSDLLKNGLIVVDVDVWSAHRKAISRAFTYNSFPTYLNSVTDGSKALINDLCSADNLTTSGSICNRQFKELLEYRNIKITSDIIMGSETSNITDKECNEFLGAFKRIKELVVGRLLRPYLMIRPIWLLHKNKREMDRMMKIVNTLSHKMTNIYRMKLSKSEDLDDKTMHDNDSQRQTDGEKPFECLIEKMISAGHSNEEIADEVNTFLIGGHETVVTAMEFLLFHLATNLDHQEKCRTEIGHLMKTHNRFEMDTITMEHLSQLKYLERCILESLRLKPPVAVFARQLDTPTDIGNECIANSGTTMLILPWIVHRNPEMYPNPEVFDPDRFLPENVKERHSHSFIPFSMGARNCIGWKIALLELKVTAAWILHYFEVTTTDGPDDVKLLFDVTLIPERPYNLIFKPLRNIS